MLAYLATSKLETERHPGNRDRQRDWLNYQYQIE